jgi:TRAP transporter TAXI family solute receptor
MIHRINGLCFGEEAKMVTINYLTFFRRIRNKIVKCGLGSTFLITIISLCFGCATPCPKITQNQKDNFLIIGTGGMTGMYYPTGGAICKIINKNRNIHGLCCSVESTKGSVSNINAIMAGDFDFGIARSDRPYQAWNGLALWRGKPQMDLRTVFSVYPECITLIAAVDAGIKTIMDLQDKKVSIGPTGSILRQNSIDALSAVGINYKKDLNAKGVRAAEAPKMLLDGRLDAFFLKVGHPSGHTKKATSGKRKVRFIPITNVEGLIEKYPYYAKAKIPIDWYPKAGNSENVETFGVWTTVVTSAKVPDEVVYNFTKEIFENLSSFKKLHPAYLLMTKENMLGALGAPIHPGALRYYKEVGLK